MPHAMSEENHNTGPLDGDSDIVINVDSLEHPTTRNTFFPTNTDGDKTLGVVDVDDALQRAARVRVKNRRRMYLERNPEYFSTGDLELADPLQYDRCIRHFQSAAEREADGRAKGWSGVLEADLYRSEAKIAAIRDAKPAREEEEEEEEETGGDNGTNDVDENRGKSRPKQFHDIYDDVPSTKEEGLERWRDSMTLRFLHGLDDDFEYKEVDENEELDEIECREAEERWFEEEEPEWFESGSEERVVVGETGIQDF